MHAKNAYALGLLLSLSLSMAACTGPNAQEANNDSANASPSSLARLSPAIREAVVDRLTGEEFAKSIGVQLLEGVPSGCTDYVEMAAGGYCLTGVVNAGTEVFVAGYLLRGRIPSLDMIDRWFENA